MLYYDLALNVPLNNLYTYYIDDSITLKIGQKVLVDFRYKKQFAYVIKVATEITIDKSKIKPILKLFDFIISHDILRLIYFLHNYYQYPLGQVIFTVVPTIKIKDIDKIYKNKNSLILQNLQNNSSSFILSSSQFDALKSIRIYINQIIQKLL